ncbi:MAG TPA: NAD(P)H-dependent glycerol-3-phosphate dehydrogenase [Candidatus Aminicenantes bacterium]|nr:NAD(P)H-dependent glycerol-3-phosphate dehydrogenase [Candidatus Aminicenantes bacterium]
MKAAVVGGGSWGSAVARYLGSLGLPTRLWIREDDILREARTTRENTTFLPGFKFPPEVEFSGDLRETAASADVVFIAVPSQFCRAAYARMAPALRKDQTLVSLTKGFDKRTLRRMSQVMEEVFAGRVVPRLTVLSGPSFAREVASGHPTAVVVASREAAAARDVQRLVSSLTLRAYTSSDVVGVEVAGALKNVIAIASGIVDALEFGLNSRAALITRGLAEITRLGVALGARRETFGGLAGVGDLVLTCTGELSRNHRVGQELGRGRSLKEILAGMKMVAEGVHTAVTARRLALSLGVEMPISEQIYQLLYRGKPVERAVAELMSRTLKAE